MTDNPLSCELFAFVKISHPAVARILCTVPGLSGLIFDVEHGAFSDPELESLCALANLSGRLSIIRAASVSPEAVTRALDRGARAVMVPRVRSVEEVERAVGALRYPPEGSRGFDPTVSGEGYGSSDGQAGSGAPRLFVQVETREALEHVGTISRVTGVSDVFVGPADLARDLGHEEEVFSADVLNAMQRVAEAVAGSGARLSAYVDGTERALWALGIGYRSLAVGSDVSFIRAGAELIAALDERARRWNEGAQAT